MDKLHFNKSMPKLGCVIPIAVVVAVILLQVYLKFYIYTIPVTYEITGAGVLDELVYSMPGFGTKTAETYETTPMKIKFFIANNKPAVFIFKANNLKNTELTLEIRVNNQLLYHVSGKNFDVEQTYDPVRKTKTNPEGEILKK